jgi:hypothetical protein
MRPAASHEVVGGAMAPQICEPIQLPKILSPPVSERC